MVNTTVGSMIPPFARVVLSAEEDLGIFLFFGEVDILLDRLERGLIDHGVDEIAEIFRVAHLDLVDLLEHHLL